jgi:uncharacterized protein YndB with AHSA1/START domain
MAECVERELALEAEPEAVWEAVTGDGWLAEEVRLELRPGGEASFRSGESARRGWVEEALAPSRLVFWWGEADQPASRVELTLERRGEAGTYLRVVESRPLEVLDVVGIPLSGRDGSTFGPALVAA